jgi:YD repeat-containing protein
MPPTDYTFAWIDAFERLPDTHDLVVVWTVEYDFEGNPISETWEQARFDGEKRRWELDSYGTSLHNPSKITHWMEITRKEDKG